MQTHHHDQQSSHKLLQNGTKRQRRTLSNCGTKEPRRRIEARLVEWQPQGKVSGSKNEMGVYGEWGIFQ